MKHTIGDLYQMQSLPLEAKITMTKARIRGWIDQYGEDGVYISFSGGKDSTVLMDIIRNKMGERSIPAYFVDVPTQYPELRDFAKTWKDVEIIRPGMSFMEVCEKYGFPIISKEISQTVYEARISAEEMKKGKKYKFGYPSRLLQLEGKLPHTEKGSITNEYSKTGDKSRYKFFLEAPFWISNRCCSVMKKAPLHKKAKETGRHPITAQMADEIEHIYPDYTLYPEQTKDTAYGFLTRGCPRGCDFCIVKDKEGLCSRKVADLCEFWNGQKNIELLDPNILASKEWQELLQQLIDSKARVNFNQGLDIRMMTKEKAAMLARIPIKGIHFAWDRYEDRDIIQPKFVEFRKASKIRNKDLVVYCIVGDRERRILPQDLERIYWLRDNGYAPYVMLYNKKELPAKHELRRLQRWVNNRFIFWDTETFEEYMKRIEGGKS